MTREDFLKNLDDFLLMEKEALLVAAIKAQCDYCAAGEPVWLFPSDPRTWYHHHPRGDDRGDDRGEHPVELIPCEASKIRNADLLRANLSLPSTLGCSLKVPKV